MIRMVVDFPAPFRPGNPVTRPSRAVNVDVVNGGEPAVLLAESPRL